MYHTQADQAYNVILTVQDQTTKYSELTYSTSTSISKTHTLQNHREKQRNKEIST